MEHNPELDKLLDAPANLGSKSPTLADNIDTSELDSKLDTLVEKNQEEVSSPPEKGDVADSDTEEARVPVSRFRKTRQELIDMREELEARRLADARRDDDLAAIRAELRSKPTNGALPDWWTNLYGDDENSRKGYELHVQAQTQTKEEIRKELREESIREQRESAERQTAILEDIDDQMDELEDTAKRKLTDVEKTAILDVVERYTPSDENGNFLGAMLPLDRAYAIFQMEQTQKRGSNNARKEVSRIASATSQGDTSSSQASPPGQRVKGAWRSKYGW
jgi:hypothetical protein